MSWETHKCTYNRESLGRIMYVAYRMRRYRSLMVHDNCKGKKIMSARWECQTKKQ